MLRGRVAYCSQVPWIMAGSLRDNIIFGNEMEAERRGGKGDLIEGGGWVPHTLAHTNKKHKHASNTRNTPKHSNTHRGASVMSACALEQDLAELP